MPMTPAERAEKCRDGKNKTGLVRKEYWNTPRQHSLLNEVSKRLQNEGALFKDRISAALLGNDHY